MKKAKAELTEWEGKLALAIFPNCGGAGIEYFLPKEIGAAKVFPVSDSKTEPDALRKEIERREIEGEVICDKGIAALRDLLARLPFTKEVQQSLRIIRYKKNPDYLDEEETTQIITTMGPLLGTKLSLAKWCHYRETAVFEDCEAAMSRYGNRYYVTYRKAGRVVKWDKYIGARKEDLFEKVDKEIFKLGGGMLDYDESVVSATY